MSCRSGDACARPEESLKYWLGNAGGSAGPKKQPVPGGGKGGAKPDGEPCRNGIVGGIPKLNWAITSFVLVVSKKKRIDLEEETAWPRLKQGLARQ